MRRRAPARPTARAASARRAKGGDGPRAVLWAPWRMAYIGGPKASTCIFCTLPQASDLRAALVLARTPAAVIMLNRYPYANAHVMVAPRRHVADLNALTATEYGALGEVLRRSVRLLQDALHPEGLNVGLNLGRAAGAGIEAHVHWHLVPRWVGDVNFMPLLTEVRVIPEHLEAVYDRLRPVFAVLERTDR